jgi:hypothetical protein
MIINEAIAVGLVTGIFGFFINYLLTFVSKDLKLTFPKSDNNSHIISLFILFFVIGSSIHLFMEFSGLNKWYCKNGVACKKLGM